jgi:flagellin-like hook-associated protein FlgL
MRVADKTTQRNYLKYLNNARNDYAETNMKIASGNRFTKLSDDVSAGTRMLNSRIELFKSEKQLSNVQAINNELKAVEDSMMSMNDVLNEIIGTKLVKAVTETTGEAGRVTIASEIKSMKEELIQFANMKFATKYPFGGTTAKVAPFSFSDDGKLLYNGIDVNSVQQRADGSRYYVDANGNKFFFDGAYWVPEKYTSFNTTELNKNYAIVPDALPYYSLPINDTNYVAGNYHYGERITVPYVATQDPEWGYTGVGWIRLNSGTVSEIL